MRQRTVRKYLSLLLIFVMVIGFMPVTGPTVLVKAEESADITGGNNEEGGDTTGTPAPVPEDSSNDETGEEEGNTPAPTSDNEGKEDADNTPAPTPSSEEGTKEDAGNTPAPAPSSDDGSKEEEGNTSSSASNDEKKDDASNTPASDNEKKEDTSNTSAPAPASNDGVKKDDGKTPAKNPTEVPETKSKDTEDKDQKKDQKAASGSEKKTETKTDKDTQKAKGTVSDNNAKVVVKVPDKPEKKETKETDEYPEFEAKKTVDGVTVTVSAEEGTFPEGTKLSVTKVSAVKEIKEVQEAVEEERGKDVNVAASYTFDIKLLDKDGKEIQPADGKKVNVSFKVAEVADKNLNTEVYHLSEEGDDYTAEELKVSEKGTEATVETTGFSYYTVEFTYDTLQYVMNGDTSIPLATILKEVGLSGEVTDVTVSNDTLFNASKETGEWIVTALKAFSSDEWMKVTINGFEYEIVVTDDPQPVVKYLDESGNEQTCTNYTVVTAETVEWAGGWYVVSETVEISAEIVCNGNVNLILCDGKTLTAQKGIHVSDADHEAFTIYAQSKGGNKGKLVANSDTADGIKAAYVTINGGEISASSKSNSAICAGVNLTINGGSVTADGKYGLYEGNGSVMIQGGILEATGTEEAIHGTVMNSIEGTGWTNTAGTAGESEIATSSEGQDLTSYKKVMFPVYTEYNLYVGGTDGVTRVTSVNASDVFGDGTVCYYATKHKLTLKGYKYKGSGRGVYYKGEDGIDKIEIELVGENIVEAEYDGFDVRNATFTGGGSLNITTTRDDQSGICGRGSGLVLNSNITATGGWGIFSEGGITISGGEIKATGRIHPGIRINNNNYLVINKGTLVATGHDKDTGKDIAISGNVKNSIPGTGWTNRAGTVGKKDIDICADADGQTFSYGKVMFPAFKEYGVWVADTRVTSDTLSGEGWSYKPDTYTLTLNGYDYKGNAHVAPGDPTAIFNREETFNIILEGTNTVVQSSDNGTAWGIYSKSDFTIGGSGKLNISTSDGNTRGAAIYGEKNVTILRGTTVNATSGTVTGNQEGYGIGSGGASSTLTIASGANVTMTGPKGGTNLTVKNGDLGTAWEDTAGIQGKANIDISETGQAIASKYKKVMFPAHVHDFTYSASGDTITATCANTDGKCDLPLVEGKRTATLTIGKPLHTTYGDGKAPEAVITDDNKIQGSATVSYYKTNKEGTEKSGEALGAAPTDAGTYWAEITLGTGEKTATAHVIYTIAPATISSVAVTDINTPEATVDLSTQATTTTQNVSLANSGEISWNPAAPQDGKAAYATVYTATVTAAADTNYVFADSVTATINGQTATVMKNEDGTLDISYTFEKTALTPVTITATDKEVTYSDDDITIPVNGMFDIPEGAGQATYSVENGTGEGIYDAQSGVLTVTKCGTFTIKVKTAETDTHAAAEATATLTVNKADNPANVAASAEVKVGGNTVDLTDNVTLNDAKGPVSYAIEGDAKGCSLSGSVLTSGDSTGFVTVKVTIAEDDNYKELVTSITVTITDKDTQTITVEDVTVEDGEKGKKVSATTSGDGKIRYAVKEGSEDYIEVDPLTGELTVKKVPENGKAYVTVIAEETKEYAQATKDVTITIIVPKHEPKIEESSGDSVLPSPDALDIIYKENGVRIMTAGAAKQIQGPAAQYAFRRILIPGCKEAFTFNFMVDGKNADFNLKHGKLAVFIPDAYRKEKRVFALLVIDKNGRVHFCPDTDFDPTKITVDLFVEGYAFDLIYVDAN